ncbi:hypothetical protein [Candidatus Clostridium stratigraminis]|uniref:Flagellar protein FliT n=1 Tax=Candidatus Clostridium stratigraminis TaxID=3381661 RepID=A0ABW8T4Y2_9CLOT
MQQDLIKRFEEFKEYTLDCITSLQNNDFDSTQNFILRRQNTLDTISNMKPAKEDCKAIAKEFELQALDEKLSEMLKLKMLELRQNIDTIEINKTAANSYNKAAFQKSNIFSKKI